MNSEDLKVITNLLEEVISLLENADCDVWNETWASHVEETKKQMIAQFLWDNLK